MSWFTVLKWKTMSRINWFFTCLVFLAFFACNKSGKAPTHTNTVFDEDSTVPIDFMDFYMNFHQDSMYQMEHIQFPLRGMPAMAIDLSQDSLNNFVWEKETWRVHKPFMGNEQEYLKEFRVISENLISEFIVEKQMGYGMERRFSKLGKQWYLIYYMDMNKME